LNVSRLSEVIWTLCTAGEALRRLPSLIFAGLRIGKGRVNSPLHHRKRKHVVNIHQLSVAALFSL